MTNNETPTNRGPSWQPSKKLADLAPGGRLCPPAPGVIQDDYERLSERDRERYDYCRDVGMSHGEALGQLAGDWSVPQAWRRYQ